MYLHLGSDFVIKNTDIIAIFNIRNQKNNVFKNYLQKQCISALTLKKRAEDDFGIEVYNRDRDN